jgi:hypothetical protein
MSLSLIHYENSCSTIWKTSWEHIGWSLKQIGRDKIHYFVNKSVDFVSDYLLSSFLPKLWNYSMISNFFRQIGSFILFLRNQWPPFSEELFFLLLPFLSILSLSSSDQYLVFYGPFPVALHKKQNFSRSSANKAFPTFAITLARFCHNNSVRLFDYLHIIFTKKWKT